MKNNFINNVIESSKYELTSDQLNCINQTANYLFDKTDQKIHIINGHAGTGKTTIISLFVQHLNNCVLLAPTGRAVKVLSLYSNKLAYTIHKYIYHTYHDELGNIRIVRAKNKKKNCVYIVDEASMISDNDNSYDLMSNINVLQDLMEFVFTDENSKLIFIGDTAQLPPVGYPESPALDANVFWQKYGVKAKVSKLTQVVRQDLESPILKNAEFLRQKIDNDDFDKPFFVDTESSNLFGFANSYSSEDEFFSTFGNYDKLTESVVICRSNKMANLYNNAIRSRALFYENIITSGERLMVVKNNYFWLDEQKQGFIANGDMIEIKRINKIENVYGFDFANVTIELTDYDDIPQLDVNILLNTLNTNTANLSKEDSNILYQNILQDYMHITNKAERNKQIRNNEYYNALQVKYGYALTCHKTQGGQWENVFIDQGFIPPEQLNKDFLRWLYTAITRSTKKVVLLRKFR
jgi:exodeoxyribonuclease-5